MGNDGIDASLGLEFSLELFKRYRQSGTLQAALRRVPGIRGPCTGYLILVNGDVVSCYLEDKQGYRYSSDKATLCRLDAEKGPFGWTLHPSIPQDAAPLNPTNPYPQQALLVPVKTVFHINLDQITATWTPQQRNALSLVWTLIDGERSIETIKAYSALHPALVDELLQMLQSLKYINVVSSKDRRTF